MDGRHHQPHPDEGSLVSAKPPEMLADQLRRVIRESGRTAYRLAGDAGVDEAQVKRFLNGERDLRLETAGKLCAALGLELTASKRRPRR